MLTQAPFPLQSRGQPTNWQAEPVCPGAQAQVPVTSLHTPAREHGARPCAAPEPSTRSAKAGPTGQEREAQEEPLQPL